MKPLHYIKASDIEYEFCFLEVSRGENAVPFMDIRISDDQSLSFVIYAEQKEILLTPEEWGEIRKKAICFYKEELENEGVFNKWGS